MLSGSLSWSWRCHVKSDPTFVAPADVLSPVIPSSYYTAFLNFLTIIITFQNAGCGPLIPLCRRQLEFGWVMLIFLLKLRSPTLSYQHLTFLSFSCVGEQRRCVMKTHPTMHKIHKQIQLAVPHKEPNKILCSLQYA